MMERSDYLDCQPPVTGNRQRPYVNLNCKSDPTLKTGDRCHIIEVWHAGKMMNSEWGLLVGCGWNITQINFKM